MGGVNLVKIREMIAIAKTDQSPLLASLLCPRCRQEISWERGIGRCSCGYTMSQEHSIVMYSRIAELHSIPETNVRDRQAHGYLKHPKFPIQIYRLNAFLDGIPRTAADLPAYELGCGPGPHTATLQSRGYKVLACDLSVRSLEVNCQTLHGGPEVAYVAADLKALQLAPESSRLLIMCDFLQHIGTLAERREFLSKAFSWLAPGGHFYLSNFNFNVKNFLKRNRHGSFAGGGITYERSTSKELKALLPDTVKVEHEIHMNIFHGVWQDRIAAAIPGAQFLARMIAIDGRKMQATETAAVL